LRLWPRWSQWRRWSLPSKLTAIGAFVAVVSFVIMIGIFVLDRCSTVSSGSSFAEAHVPDIALSLVNSSEQSVTLLARGDFVLWLPAGVGGGAPSIPGKYVLRPEGVAEDYVDVVTIEASSTLSVLAHLENPTQIAPVLDAGSTDLDFIFRRPEGGLTFSGPIPFTRSRIEVTCWQVEVSKD